MSKYKFKEEKPCHILTEIYPNLFIGAYKSFPTMVTKAKVDILVPLADLEGSVWDYGFNGKILYYPILDYETLPIRILDRAVGEIIDFLSEGKRIGIFCNGGHGRTGYLAACILGKLGIRDPVKDLRVRYCSKAIETNEQIKQISDYLKKPELYDKYKEKESEKYKSLYEYWGKYGTLDYYYNPKEERSENLDDNHKLY